MITTTDKVQSVINDLMIINNDRYEGYKTAAEETRDVDLKAMFTRFSSQSKIFHSELSRLILDSKTPGKNETTLSGKLYRTWMDIKAAVTANNRKIILASCEFGEDVALNAYKDALLEDDLPEEIRITLRKHKDELQDAHNTIKSLRDRA